MSGQLNDGGNILSQCTQTSMEDRQALCVKIMRHSISMPFPEIAATASRRSVRNFLPSRLQP